MHTEATSRAPRILTQSGESSLRSVCDLPQIRVTPRRHRERCPHASIGILANTPHPHRARCPVALPIPSRALDTSSVASELRKLFARLSARQVRNAQIGCVREKGWLAKKAVGRRSSLRRLVELNRAEIQQHGPAVATGMRRHLTHANPSQSDCYLTFLNSAEHLGYPTATLGQPLVSRISAVLPEVDLLGLRTGRLRRGPLLQARAGLPADSFKVIGDVAIDLAFTKRRDGVGTDVRAR